MEEQKDIVKAEPQLPVPVTKFAEEPEDITVIAATPGEMDASQKQLIAWAEKKLAAKQSEVREAEENLAIAKKRKWRAGPFESIVYKAKKKEVFYEKILAALKAGYCIVPNMDIEVFAVRTHRKKPKRNQASTTNRADDTWKSTPHVKDQEASLARPGEGRYVDPATYEKEAKQEYVDPKTGTKMERKTRWASSFDEEIDFPFKLAKAKILDATGEAMALKIFDEVGMLPRTRGADPMIIGRVTHREGYHRKQVCFVISWFVDTREL